MKNTFLLGTLILSAMTLSACAESDVAVKTADGEPAKPSVVAEVVPVVIPFAEVNEDIMDATDNYKLFYFREGDGTCLEKGFPTNLVYAAPNMIKTLDEKYVEDMTAVDFTGRISFNELPLGEEKVACEIKTVKGITTAQMTCSTGSGEEKKEVCAGSFKVYAEK